MTLLVPFRLRYRNKGQLDVELPEISLCLVIKYSNRNLSEKINSPDSWSIFKNSMLLMVGSCWLVHVGCQRWPDFVKQKIWTKNGGWLQQAQTRSLECILLFIKYLVWMMCESLIILSLNNVALACSDNVALYCLSVISHTVGYICIVSTIFT